MSSVGSFIERRKAFQILPAQLLSRAKRAVGRDFLTFGILTVLGFASAFISIPIPHTPLNVDPRFAVGAIGFVLIRRLGLVFLMILALCVAGPHRVPLHVALLGNLLYALPLFATIRFVHDRWLDRLAHPVVFAVCWFLLILAGYQAFVTPATFAVKAMVQDRNILENVAASWASQPFVHESVFVALISALALALIREHASLVFSHQRWMTTFDAIGDAAIVTDAQGLIQQMNPVAETLTGWRLEEARGKQLMELVRLEDCNGHAPIRCPIARALEQGRTVSISQDTILISRNDRRMHIADSASPIRRGDGETTGAVLVFRDTTADYEARHALQRSEERFRTFVENANDIVYALTPEGIFTYVSPNWQEHLGEPAEKAIGRGFDQYVLEEDLHICREFLERVLRTGQRSSSVDYRVRRADGQIRWHSSTGSPLRGADGSVVAYMGIARDITQRRSDAELLQQHMTFLAKTGQLARVGGWEIDVEKKRSTLSQAAKELCEMEGDWDPTVEDTLRMSPPESRRRLREVYDRAVREGIPFDVEADLVTGKGNQLRIRLIGTPEFRDGKCVRIYGATQDITRLHELELQLRHAQKMEALGQLAGGVAHDFNNLLTPILGLADLALASQQVQGDLRESLEDIQHAASQARDLTSQLLALGRRQVLQVKPMDLTQFIRGEVSVLRRLIRENIELELELAEDLPAVDADETQMSQVLINLTINAVDAMDQGGRLRFQTRRASPEELDDLQPDVPPGPCVVLSVSDTGCGMVPEQQEHIFEPFFTTKQQEKGTGLGLATVYGVIRQHNGTIQLDSIPEDGTTFRIYLPAHWQELPDASADQARRQPETIGRKTILVVEDDSSVLRFTARCLDHLGHRVLAAETPDAAMRIAREHDGPIDLLLSDVVMPGKNGLEMHQLLCRERPDLPVLFMSGYTSEVIDTQGHLAEGMDLIQKPFTADELDSRIRTVLQQRVAD
jgi:PAS domain S-box-containing protein